MNTLDLHQSFLDECGYIEQDGVWFLPTRYKHELCIPYLHQFEHPFRVIVDFNTRLYYPTLNEDLQFTRRVITLPNWVLPPHERNAIKTAIECWNQAMNAKIAQLGTDNAEGITCI